MPGKKRERWINRMQKNGSSILAIILVALLVIPMISAPIALGAEGRMPAVQTVVKAEITLEKAILIVKTNFDVPNEYTDFNSTYNTYENRQAWSLRWNAPAGKPGEFSAEVNAINGDILSMNYRNNDGESSNSGVLPAITKAAALEISDKLLTRLLGERSGMLRLIPSEQAVVPINNYGTPNYSIQYQRLINEIPFLSNGVNVQVSSIDGQVISYNLNWSEEIAPEAKGVIEASEAQKAFTVASFLKLRYWVPASYRPLAAGQKQEAKLVYQLTGHGGGAIDAFTGEPLELEEGDWIATDSFGNGGMGESKTDRAGSIPSGTQVLTPQEQLEVERNAKLLKQDEAIAAVQSWVGIPENLTLRSANLSTDWRSTDKRIWNFDWNNNGTEISGGKPQYLSARVSATTGELLGFNVAYQQTGKTEVTLDQDAVQKLAEEFLKRVQAKRFSQVALDPLKNVNAKISPEQWNIQYLTYHRVVNGVDFPDNGMTVTVDPVAGIVTGYELNWSDSNLPSVSGILSKDKGAESFLKARPLNLYYVRVHSNGIPGNLRLVYIPVNQDRSLPVSNILDAKSGELLDYEGQPLEKGPKPYSFSDLTEVNGAQEIAALGQAGLFGDFGNSFKPDEKMGIASLLRTMYYSRFGLSGNTSLTNSEIMTKAKVQGWVKEDLKPEDTVNRELLSKVLLRYLQLNKLAELKDIYHVTYQDAAEINPDALGYIALASSTGLLKVEGLTLAPREAVSRAEAAVALFRTLGWRN